MQEGFESVDVGLSKIYVFKRMQKYTSQLVKFRANEKSIDYSGLEVCMGMGKTGIPWVPWDSYGNGNKISHGMGMGWEWELSAWEWELRRGSCHQQL